LKCEQMQRDAPTLNRPNDQGRKVELVYGRLAQFAQLAPRMCIGLSRRCIVMFLYR
jgi:hypothetical protein